MNIAQSMTCVFYEHFVGDLFSVNVSTTSQDRSLKRITENETHTWHWYW
jgi:hypothetical protein